MDGETALSHLPQEEGGGRHRSIVVSEGSLVDMETALSHLPQEGCGGRHRSIVVSEGSLVDMETALSHLPQEEGGGRHRSIVVSEGSLVDMETALSHLPQEGCGGRHRSIVVSEGSLVDLWCGVGSAQGLNTDADVARFLLSQHLDDQGCGPQPGDKCRHCGGPVTLLCVKCQRSQECSVLSLPPSQDSLDLTAPSSIRSEEAVCRKTSLQETPALQLFPVNTAVAERSTSFTDTTAVAERSTFTDTTAVAERSTSFTDTTTVAERSTSFTDTTAVAERSTSFTDTTTVAERSTSFTDTTAVAERSTSFTDTIGELRSDQRDTCTLNVLPSVECDMELDAETFEAEGDENSDTETFEAEGDENSDTGRDVVPRDGTKALTTKGRAKKTSAKKRINKSGAVSINKRGAVSRLTVKTPFIALRKCDYLLKGVEKTNGEDQQTSQISAKRKQSSKSARSKFQEKVTSRSSTQKDLRDRENNFVKSRKRIDNSPDIKAKMASHVSDDSDKDQVDTELEQFKAKSNKHPTTEAQTLAEFMTGKYPVTIGKPGKEQFRSHHTCSQCGVVVETQSQLDEHERGTGSRPCGVQSNTEAASQALDAESIALLERVKDRYLLSCPDCERVFTRKLNLVEHVVSHRCGVGEVKALTCHFCGMKYRHHRTLMNHVEILTTRESCSVCCEAFTAQCQIKAHMVMHAGGQKHKKCKYCEEFVPLKEMRAHYKRHRRENPSCLCPHCGNQFPDKGHLNAHLVVHNKNSLYPCSQCERGFKTLSRLTNHQLHHGERNEQCEQCGQKFFTTKTLRNHIRITHDGQRFSCPTCGLKVTERKALDHHIRRVHLKIKPYVCSTCNMSFLLPSHLVMHSRTHTGDKPYHCQYCPAKFAFVHYLRRHELIHTGERPYSCETCGQQYRDKKSYKEHRKKKHSDKLYPCQLCGKEFPIQDSLSFHLHRVHHVEPDADMTHTVQGSQDVTDTSVTGGQGSHDASLTPGSKVTTLPVGDSTNTGIPDSLTSLDHQVSHTAGDMEKDPTLFPAADQTDPSDS
ncbi:uncharacterized protein [Littorina saxatilis]